MNKLLTLLALASATAAIATPQAHADQPKFLGVFIRPVILTYPYYGYGMQVTSVMPGSPAESIGLKAGDTITGINGIRTRNHYDVLKAYSTLKVGVWTPVDIITAEGKPWRPWAIKSNGDSIAYAASAPAGVAANAPKPVLGDAPGENIDEQPQPNPAPPIPPMEPSPPTGSSGFPFNDRP